MSSFIRNLSRILIRAWAISYDCWKYLRTHPVDTGRKLNAHKTFRRRPGRLLNVVLVTFNLRPVSTGHLFCKTSFVTTTEIRTKTNVKYKSQTLGAFIKVLYLLLFNVFLIRAVRVVFSLQSSKSSNWIKFAQFPFFLFILSHCFWTIAKSFHININFGAVLLI